VSSDRGDRGNEGSLWLFVAALAFSPYYIVANDLLGRPTIAGKAVLLVAVSGSMVIVSAIHWRYLLRRLGGVLLIGVWLAAAIVLYVKQLVYGIALDLLAYRFAFVGVVYGCAALPFVRSPASVRLLRRVLLWSCVVQAVLGIIHSKYFPYIVTGIPLTDSGQAIYVLPPGSSAFRENGTLISANLYGAVLVLGLFILFAGAGRLRGRTLLRVLAPAALLWWAIALSGSRLALAGGLLATGYALTRSAPAGVAAIAVPAAFAALLLSSVPARVEERFAIEGSGGRGAMLVRSFELATQRFSSAVVGPTPTEAASATTATGQILSDNSYVSLVFDYGWPFALLLIWYFGLIWSSIVTMRGWVLVTSCFVAVQFAITNAIYWDPFLMFAGATLLVVDALHRPVLGAGATVAIGARTAATERA